MRKSNVVLLGGALALSLSAAGVAHADPVMVSADLDGGTVAPGSSGTFTGEIDTDSGDVCYVLTIADLANVTAAHIHVGAEGETGKPVVPLQITGEDEDVCVAGEPDALKQIVANPAGYYVNVHTAEQPAGAMRGQLSKIDE